MEGFFLLGIVLIGLLVILPIVSMSIIRDLKGEVQSLAGRMNSLCRQIEKLTNSVNELQIPQTVSDNIENPISEPEPVSEEPISNQTITEEIPVVEEFETEAVTEFAEEIPLPPPPPVPPIPSTPSISEVPPSIPVIDEYVEEEIIQQEEEIVVETEVIPEERIEPTTYFAEEKTVEEEKIVLPIEEKSPSVSTPIPPIEKEQSLFSQLWGENLLSKIGIVTFVLGIAFFVKYAIDKDWINEIGRVGIGLLVGGAIIGIAHKLRKQYDVFSSILAGGGFAVFYITITLAFREYELIPQGFAFVLLIIVTIACVLLSLLYDKKELAIFSLLGGFAAPFLVSTGSGNYIVLFSYILLLNTGMMLVAFRKNWLPVNICVFALSQLVIWVWLLKEFDDQYIGVSAFLLLFFVQFYVMGLADHLKKGGKITPFQAMVILWNNILFFAAALFVLRDYTIDLKGVITISLASFNAIALMVVFKNKQVDKNLIYLLIATVLSLVTLAVPIQLEGNAITMFWAAEIVILLILWQQSRIDIFRYGIFGVTTLVLISYLMDLVQGYGDGISSTVLPIIFNRYFITGITVGVALFVSKWLLQRAINKDIPLNETERQTYHSLNLIFTIALYVISFLVFICELNYQIDTRINYHIFRIVTLLTYVLAYITLLVFLKRKLLADLNYTPIILLGTVIGYNILYAWPLAELREDLYFSSYDFPISYFYIHLISLPLIGYIIYQMARYIRKCTRANRSVYLWILTIATVVIFTWETDNLIILCVGNPGNYHSVLHAIHTFGYPILWGLLAMALMIMGLKSREIVLRKISLLFFAFIIGKFYLYDVWRMSQAGRIVSFVALGIILLVVSFLLQRIKNLVKEDNKDEKETTI